MGVQNNLTWNAHFRSEAILDAATNVKVLDAVGEVVGKDIVLLHTAIFAKYPLATSGVNKPGCPLVKHPFFLV